MLLGVHGRSKTVDVAKLPTLLKSVVGCAPRPVSGTEGAPQLLQSRLAAEPGVPLAQEAADLIATQVEAA